MLCAGALFVSLWLTALAAAETGHPIGTYVIRFATTTTIQLADTPTGDSAYGRVSSRKRGCRAGRAVTLISDPGGSGNRDAYVELGTVHSAADGAWTIPIAAGIKPADRYFALIRPKRLRKTPNHAYNCGGWTTSSIGG